MITNDKICDKLSVEIKKYQDDIEILEVLKSGIIIVSNRFVRIPQVFLWRSLVICFALVLSLALNFLSSVLSDLSNKGKICLL